MKSYGQLVQTALSEESSDRGYSAVLVRAKLRNSVFLRVNDHAAELVNIKSSSVCGKSYLLVQNRTAVIELDGDRRNKHERQGRNESHQRKYYVKSSLEKSLLKIKTVIAAKQERSIEKPEYRPRL